jgi:DAK2 domain fusion protein YloV
MVSITVIDGYRFANMIFQGANHLSANAKYVDSLNVFPVPDGDTGTNMNLSIQSGAREVKNHIQPHVGKVGAALARGLLMGARGNSGVILSQLFRGFSRSIETKETLSAVDFAKALKDGVEMAYKAVMRPVEGTILTVAKDSANRAEEVAKKTDDLVTLMEEVVKEAKASLKRTPDLLPVLKEVGVVDSGGQGLVFVYEGFLAELKGIPLKTDSVANEVTMEQLVKQEHHKAVQSFISTDEIVYGYCTEFMVKLDPEKSAAKSFSEEAFRNGISKFGDSLLVISDDEIVKVHIHTEHPGDVLNYGQRYGELINLKIENMRQQHTNIVGRDKTGKPAGSEENKEKEYGIVTVAMGSGVRDLFKSIGAHVVVEGGQTMNPSTEDLVKAIEETHAKTVFVLPNNKNIIMAAEQAKEVSGRDVVVIPTKTIPQGLSALLAFNPVSGREKNVTAMKGAIEHVKSGQITFAVRDTQLDGLSIKKDDYMGILEGDIVVSTKDLAEAAEGLLERMLDEDSEIITIIRGADADDAIVEKIKDFLDEHYPDVELEIHDGNQPLYPFIFSVE